MMKHNNANRPVTNPNIRKTSLHPINDANMDNGPAADIAPMLPTAITMPFNTAKSCLGNHMEISFIKGT